MKVVAGILAGGIGSRVGAKLPKQFIEIGGIPILIRSLKKFSSFQVVVAMNPEWMDYAKNLFKKYNLKDISLIEGGKTRQLSSYNATSFFKDYNPDYILIHDAARCFVRENLIRRLIEKINGEKFDGVIPVISSTDSLVEVGDSVRYLSRDKVFKVQTPQIFRFNVLYNVHKILEKRGDVNFTDDGSMLVECGYRVGVVNGDHGNIKISTPLDLKISQEMVGDEG